MGRMHDALKRAETDRTKRLEGGGSAPKAGPAGTAGATTMYAPGVGFRAGELDPHLVSATDPRSLPSEQYRTLRANLLELGSGEAPKVVLVTSAVEGEGKSITTVNLACCLAEDGRRVVVVDADMRRPSVHRLLGVDNDRGLSDYLAGGTMLELVLQRASLPNLWVLPSGRLPGDPGELLGGKRLDDLLARLRRDYDFVVLDSPPVGPTTDAAVVAPRADGALLVVRMESTPREAAKQAVDLLRKARANVLGTVLTGLPGDARERCLAPAGREV